MRSEKTAAGVNAKTRRGRLDTTDTPLDTVGGSRFDIKANECSTTPEKSGARKRLRDSDSSREEHAADGKDQEVARSVKKRKASKASKVKGGERSGAWFQTCRPRQTGRWSAMSAPPWPRPTCDLCDSLVAPLEASLEHVLLECPRHRWLCGSHLQTLRPPEFTDLMFLVTTAEGSTVLRRLLGRLDWAADEFYARLPEISDDDDDDEEDASKDDYEDEDNEDKADEEEEEEAVTDLVPQREARIATH